MGSRQVLLSFDVEEFDVPAEHGVSVPLEEQVRISAEGTVRILDLLKRKGVLATFYCTVQFAQLAGEVMRRIVRDGHEVASHGYYHGQFEETHLRASREELERLLGVPVRGYRQARMMPLSDVEVRKAGYTYNSSLNPTFIPGRYMHLSAPRRFFMAEGVLQIPASVTPWFRIPLFWLSCHHFPLWLYRWLCARTLRHDGYLSIYFHPWEFFPLNSRPDLGLPYLIRHNSGLPMELRLERLIDAWRGIGATFETYGDFARRHFSTPTEDILCD